MERITDPPPPEVVADLLAMRAAMDRAVPAKMLDRNLLIATWRWQLFDRVTEKWIAEENDQPPRDLRAILCLAEVVSRFDIVAIQGLMGDARGLQILMEALGENWALMVTGLSRESSYNERSAFVFDTRKVLPRGLAGQLVLGDADAKQSGDGSFLSRQFFRPPLFAGFRCLHRDFTLANIHLVFGLPKERRAEMTAFVGWLREVSQRGYFWERNLIALGQLQLLSTKGVVYRALTESGLRVPADLHDIPTIVNSRGMPGSMISSIAWFGDDSGPAKLDLAYLRGGVFNFLSEDLPFQARNFDRYLTSHLPVWTEFSIRRLPSHKRVAP